MSTVKIMTGLQQRIDASDPTELLDVIVEFTSQQSDETAATSESSATLPRGERIAAQKREFVAMAAPVEQLVADLGGKVIDRAWINKTLHARLPASGIEKLTGPPDVRKVDLPHRLTRE